MKEQNRRGNNRIAFSQQQGRVMKKHFKLLYGIISSPIAQCNRQNIKIHLPK